MFSNLNKSHWTAFGVAIGFTILSGIASVMLIAYINDALAMSGHERLQLLWPFVLTVFASVSANLLAGVLFYRVGQQVLADIRLRIAKRVMDADYRHIESVGDARIQSALTEDSTHVANALIALPLIITNGVIVLGCLAYMAALSLPIFFYGLLTLGIGGLSYHWVHQWALTYLHQASEAQTQLYQHFSALIHGAKELKLSRQKRHEFEQQMLGETVDQLRDARTKGLSIFRITTGWGNLIFFVFVGVVLFALMDTLVEGKDAAQVATGFALAVLYMLSPLQNMLNGLPAINMAKIAWRRIEAVIDDMPVTIGDAPQGDHPPLQSISLEQVTYTYYHEQSDDFFRMGPINLQINAGELVFLVGGNGSGKTSLAKLILGLYEPEQGRLLLNGEPVNTTHLDAYRQHFAAVFSDFHLFERLLGAPSPELDQLANQLIEKLHLHHKVRVQASRFSTQALSQGQRKRLALIAACLEDRPFMVFDEWAADQDPTFKAVFYRELLPELKQQGKTLLVISHDDRYFHLADRLLTMETGQLIGDRPVLKDAHQEVEHV